MKIRTSLLIVVLVTLFYGAGDYTNHSIQTIEGELREGDIIFQSSKSQLSTAIQLATKSQYSHVGILFNRNDKFMVYEAIQPVKITPVQAWIDRGEKGHYVVKRLENADKVLTAFVIDKMKQVGNSYLGKDYDGYFEWSDERIYCSELVWKVYKEGAGIEVGSLQKLSEFNLNNKVVKKELNRRYGNNIPMDELVISPEAIFQSKKLITVIQN